jgi:hypothetical protein
MLFWSIPLFVCKTLVFVMTFEGFCLHFSDNDLLISNQTLFDLNVKQYRSLGVSSSVRPDTKLVPVFA